jgi:hypothetical protein
VHVGSDGGDAIFIKVGTEQLQVRKEWRRVHKVERSGTAGGRTLSFGPDLPPCYSIFYEGTHTPPAPGLAMIAPRV